ncbi:hypothetical protein [Pengzhenrongella frigida]|uniref:Sugar phosphate isomerase/epimerase n=1 Tax=Pengzhenrongella frigida TaxID=1259133 RepID=A0A4Q5N0Z8_9MICO|nr:hypothetical protein [Cellulomonas sp. HLT2-17]RYV51706.1 hypothetical protein EUA98_07330 [Cellulomonas sp. HLT2-17]
MSTAGVRSAITAMWVWDNAVSPADDDEGRGYAPASPDRLAAFATAGELQEVYLAAPSAGSEGPVAESFGETCGTLHAVGVEVSALGGDAEWLAAPGLVEPWLAHARGLGSFDRVQLAVEPWALPGWAASKTAALAEVLTLLDRTRSAGNGLPVDIAVPWWLAHEPFTDLTAPEGTTMLEDATMLDAVLARADRVSILALADHASGPDGILALASRAVRAAVTAGREFTIGVETCSPEVAGGAQFTFFDEGPVGLLREAGLVRARLGEVAGYRGVAVSDHRAWRRLLGV